MTIQVLEQQFSVCKVADYGDVDCCQPFVFTGSTDAEKSLVCPTECAPASTIERVDGWRAFRIEGQLDFSLVGILAHISSVLAAVKIGLFAISTFDTDYILVKEVDLDRALAALAKAGDEISFDSANVGAEEDCAARKTAFEEQININRPRKE